MTTYCEYVLNANGSGIEYHKAYHDSHYGFPIEDDNELFGRLILEINQAGLNWLTMLKKEAGFREAYSNFEISKIARYDDNDRERLLSDSGIIRNRLKVGAAIHNAQVVVELQKEYGSFKSWLDYHHPKTKDQWVKLFKKTFKFTGGEITNEFLMSTGYLEGAHTCDCPTYHKVLACNPPWVRDKM